MSSNAMEDAFAYFGFTPGAKKEPAKKSKSNIKITSCNVCPALIEGNTAGIYTCKIYGPLENMKFNILKTKSTSAETPIKSIHCKYTNRPTKLTEIKSRIATFNEIKSRIMTTTQTKGE